MCKFWSLLTIAVLLPISGPAWADPDDPFDGPPEIRPDGAVPDIIWPEFQPRQETQGTFPAQIPVPATTRSSRPAIASGKRTFPVRNALGFSQHTSASYVAVPASPSLDSLTDGSNAQLTLTAWVYPTADMDNGGILYKGPLNGSQGTFQVGFAHGIGHPNELNFRLNGAVGTAGEVTSSDPIPNNQWTFIACTYDGSRERIYINGALNASASYHAPLENDTSDLCIGIYCSTTYNYNGHYISFQGEIAEVGVWKQALDATTISALYHKGQGKYGNRSRLPWHEDFIAGYHLNEGRGTTVADFSGNGNDGTLKNGATWVPDKVAAAKTPTAGISTALQFDGPGYATLPQSLKFTSGDFTICLWFNPTTTKAQVLFMRLYAYRNQKGDIGLKINPSGNLDFQAMAGPGVSDYVFGWDAPESRLRSPFKLKEWNHVVVTRRGDTYTMWMNGARAGSEVSPADISDADNTNPFLVGGLMHDSGVEDVFKGSLGEVRIYNRALSQAEIAVLYANPARATNRGLAAGYHFDEGRGTTIADFSGHGNTGTLHGGVTWTHGKAASQPASATVRRRRSF